MNIGFDSQEVRAELEIIQLSLSEAITNRLERRELSQTYAKCSVCGAALAPLDMDENHHVATDPATGQHDHYCEAHCPACRGRTGLFLP